MGQVASEINLVAAVANGVKAVCHNVAVYVCNVCKSECNLCGCWVVGFQDEVLPQTCSFMRSDNIIGDTVSLSDARLKTEVMPVSGDQALSVLSQIQGCTYEREDLGQRRLGLIADEVEEATDKLAIDNVLGSRWHEGEQYKALDYSRLVSLLIPAVNHLSQEVKVLKSKVNGASS